MKAIRSLVGSSAIALALATSPVLADETVVVSDNTSAGENEPGWLFNRDPSTSTPYEFNFEQSSIGLGSLYVLPIGANALDKFIGEYFILTPVAEVNGISYDFLIGPGGTAADANEFYMNVYANFGESDPLKFYDCRYNIVPASGSTVAFTTVSFDPTLSYPVTTRNTSPYTCPAAPADMDMLSPGSTVRVIALNVGDTTAGDTGLDGYYDNVVVDTASGVTTFDFDPGKDACKKGGWKNFVEPEFKNQGDCVSYVANGGKN